MGQLETADLRALNSNALRSLSTDQVAALDSDDLNALTTQQFGAMTTAQVANFIALGRGQMSVIIPLLNITPLFSVFFSVLFLRAVETVNLRIATGAALMVGGVVLITSR